MSDVASSITGRTSRQQRRKCFCEKTMRDKLAEANIIVRPIYVFGKLDEAERERNFNPWLCYHHPDRACLGVSRHEGGPSCPAPKQCSCFFVTGSLQMATCPCSAAGSEAHARSLGLVGNACGCSPSSLASLKRTGGVAFCCGYAISTSATNFAARDGEPSAMGVAISAACNVSTVISAFRS